VRRDEAPMEINLGIVLLVIAVSMALGAAWQKPE
jgi:hypothetical protein